MPGKHKRESLSTKEWLTVTDIAGILNISKERARLRIKTGYFSNTRQDENTGTYYVHRDAIVPFIHAGGGKHGTRE